MSNVRRQLPTIVALCVIGGIGVFGVIAIWSGADLPVEVDAGREEPAMVAGSLAAARPPSTGASAAKNARATPAGFAPDEVVRAQLVTIGERELAALRAQVWPMSWRFQTKEPVPEQSIDTEIEAIGPCERPSAAERAQLAERIGAVERTREVIDLRFGCKERGGIVIDLVYEREPRSIWKVVRASDATAAARITTLLQETSLSRMQWMEWAPLLSLRTMVLADLDGDGVRDPLAQRSQGTGGSSAQDVTLSAWPSTTRRRVTLGDAGQGAQVAAQTWQPGAPLVLRMHERDEGQTGDPTRSDAQVRYRCVALTKPATAGAMTGSIAPCPESAAARQHERAAQIAIGFAQGTTYPPHGRALPDRQLLAQLLGELGSPAAEIAATTALVAPGEPAVQVARALVRARAGLVEPPRALSHGEWVAAPDPRGAALLAMLGDQRCPAMSAALQRRVTAKISSWLDATAEALLQQRRECEAGQPCRWQKAKLKSLNAGCPTSDADADGLYAVRWGHSDGDYRMLAIDALIALEGDEISLVTAQSVEGEEVECAACAGPPPPQLEIELYRRGGKAAALVKPTDLGPATSAGAKPARLVLVVGAALTALPPPSADGHWYRFGEAMGDAPRVPSLIEVSSPDDAVLQYWHWEEGWQQLATFAMPTLTESVPHLDAVGTWLWHQQRRVQARAKLDSFSTADWSTPAYREEVQRALLIAGADQATRDEVAALAKQP